MADAAYLHCTGPVLIWIRTDGAAGTPHFLGTCEQHPVMESEPNWERVMNDLGGFMTPFDLGYQGAVESVIMDVNRFDENIFEKVDGQPAFVTAGSNAFGDRGMYAVQPKGGSGSVTGGFEMWLQYSFFGTVNAVPDLPRGWYYPVCIGAQISTPKQGLKTMLRRLVVEANNKYTYDSASGTWSFKYKSNSSTDFAALSGLKPN